VQFVHTRVPLSPSGIIWLCSAAGKVNVGLLETNGVPLSCIYHIVSCRLTALRPGSAICKLSIMGHCLFTKLVKACFFCAYAVVIAIFGS